MQHNPAAMTWAGAVVPALHRSSIPPSKEGGYKSLRRDDPYFGAALRTPYNTKPLMADQKKTRREILEEFLAKDPNDAFTRYGLAMECMNGGDSSAADAHFRLLIDQHAEYVPAYLIYGQFLARESRNDEARKILTAGIAAAEKANNQHARSEMEALLTELS